MHEIETDEILWHVNNVGSRNPFERYKGMLNCTLINFAA